jgi:LacI family transcriptional regulator, repressor for deo operon, udp, cdd, tsx, nupC, and nupG
MEKKLPTIKEIAKQLNISVSTVSRALHNHHSIGLGTRLKVQQLAKEMDYEPNQAAINFQQGKTFTLGVILPELREAFFSDAISGIEDCATKAKYSVLIGQSHDDIEKEIQLIQTMRNHRVDGLLISVAKSTNTYAHLQAIQKYGIPVVYFDRIPAMDDIHYVACNLVSGTSKAVEYLISKGHRVIGLINGPDNLVGSNERLNGYISTLAKHKIKYDPQLIINTDLSERSVEEAMQKIIRYKKVPSAIVAFNDYLALHAIEFIREQKIKAHKQMSFVSFANHPMSLHSAKPPLASVEQFPYIQGQKAAETLIDLLNLKSKGTDTNTAFYKIILEPQLIIHEKK